MSNQGLCNFNHSRNDLPQNNLLPAHIIKFELYYQRQKLKIIYSNSLELFKDHKSLNSITVTTVKTELSPSNCSTATDQVQAFSDRALFFSLSKDVVTRFITLNFLHSHSPVIFFGFPIGPFPYIVPGMIILRILLLHFYTHTAHNLARNQNTYTN